MTQPSARVICDSVSPQGIRLTTMEVTLHRFVLAELNTHRVFSRNYRSSRAVPVARLLEEVRTNPAMPVFWGKNQAGMQAAEELEGNDLVAAREQWTLAARDAVTSAEVLSGIGLHKQIANRVLEPFLWVHGVVTSTEWDNFFGLRLDRAAQPEMRTLAEAMWTAREASKPVELRLGWWHLPYVGQVESYVDGVMLYDQGLDGWKAHPTSVDNFIKQSVARCARVSVKPFKHDRPSTLAEDLALYEKLVGAQSIHASPAEHQATPDEPLLTFPDSPEAYRCGINRTVGFLRPELHGNFLGWVQYRKTLIDESVAPLPAGYAR